MPISTQSLQQLLQERILILDGAMGTMVQSYRLQEADFRGERFADWHLDLRGNNDLLTLTRPDVVREIHRAYLDAGADIIETNTFTANDPSMADYGMESLVEELNRESARLARLEADACTQRINVNCDALLLEFAHAVAAKYEEAFVEFEGTTQAETITIDIEKAVIQVKAFVPNAKIVVIKTLRACRCGKRE